MPDEVTRGEFEMLRQMVQQNQNRLENIDASGTRGVAVIQSQMTDLIRDMADLKAEFKSEQITRIQGRRWVLAMAITGTAAIAGLVSALIEVVTHIHGG